MTKTDLEMFGGNGDLDRMVSLFGELVQIWDDLIDKDKEVSDDSINHAFHIALVSLPSNPLYRAIQPDILPMWSTVIMAFEVANGFERMKDDHGLEISHNLRYALGHIIAYAMNVALGYEKATELMPRIWKEIIAERFADYKKEHLGA